MNRTELKQILINVAAGVLSTCIAGLLLSNNLPKAEPKRLPQPMYVQHQEPAYAGDQVLVITEG